MTVILKCFLNTLNVNYKNNLIDRYDINDYDNEEFVFVVNGKQEFVDKVNEFLQLNESRGYIINCYEIFDMKVDTYSIISKHNYYINTSGIVKKEVFNK